MGTKMKDILKGLRYITQIFDAVEEEEMQIGFPTDVKHLAHVGCDGPNSSNSSAPSWMTGYRSTPSKNNATEEGGGSSGVGLTLLCRSEDLSCSGGTQGAAAVATGEGADPATTAPLPRIPRRKPSAGGESGGPDSPAAKRDASTSSRRRHQSAGSHPAAEGSTRRRSKASSSSSSMEIVGEQSDPLQEIPAAAKQARRKKTKGGGSGSTRPSRSKGAAAAEAAAEERSGELPPPAPAKREEEEGEKIGVGDVGGGR